MNPVGHVDRYDKFLIAGWALYPEDPTRSPTVTIIQNEHILLAISPIFPAPQLRQALGLLPSTAPPLYAWRLWLPLANGLKPDHDFSIVFADSGLPLQNGERLRISLFTNQEGLIPEDVREHDFFVPSFNFSNHKLSLSARIEYGKASPQPTLALGSRIELQATSIQAGWLGKDEALFNHEIDATLLEEEECKVIRLTPKSQHIINSDIYSSCVPASIFSGKTKYPIPDIANIHRVSGPTSDQAQYLIGGLTTFHQIAAILRIDFQRELSSFSTILDWGVGCGRVLRHFHESTALLGIESNDNWRLIGLDIDGINIEWCKTHMGDAATFDLLSFSGFDVEASSVDLIYGISVFTHLAEHEQHRWLAEIHRILKPGGVAIFTIHGECVYYREPESIALPFVEKFGFFDGISDAAIGEDRDSYYRATFHSRQYVYKEWSAYFDIKNFYPMANAFRQDFVVLAKR